MEVFTRNFLQEFEAEQALLETEDWVPCSDLRPPSLCALSNYAAVKQAQYKKVPNQEKVAIFQGLYKPLERFADDTVADLRIEYDASMGKGNIQLKYQTLDSSVWVEPHGHKILALLFRLYPDFSVTAENGTYIVLKFYADFTDEVQVADYSKQLELLRECIGLFG